MSAHKISVVLPLLVPTKFLRYMTGFCIKTLREHADYKDFELVVVEGGGSWFDPKENPFAAECGSYRYLCFHPMIGAIKEMNAGIDAATGDFIVFLGNDTVAPPHWDTHLLRCFEERKDCGVASLSAYEPGAIIGPPTALDRIVEGFYSPFMMWRKGVRWDEAYRKIYADSDMVMRIYENGQRAFRTCRAHCHHLNRMTSDNVNPVQHSRNLAVDEETFYSRWGRSPLAMFAMIRAGHQIYGREWEAFEQPIHRHTAPAVI